ncbi:MAG: uroporphyrinogen decarboxylase family protein [bacterium]
MTSRERVLTALKHKEPDVIPWDLGGMRSTGIMAIAYAKLRKALKLPLDGIKVYDVGQQLAWVDEDIRRIFPIDVVALDTEKVLADYFWGWKPYKLPDDEGTQALIPANYNIKEEEDGSRVIYDGDKPVSKMPAGGYYFDSIYYPLANVSSPKDIEKWEMGTLSEEMLSALRREAKNLYENTDYAIMGSFGGNIVEGGQALMGWENFMSALLLNRELVEALINKMVEGHLRNLELYLNAVGDYIQIIQMGDDLGTQSGPALSPRLYKELIFPAHKKIYDFVHRKAPHIFVFLHSCGGIYELIPYLIEAGVDILNPVQTSAVNMEPERLKKEFGKDLVFWGGGCDTQRVLPFAEPEEVRKHIKERINIFSKGGGFVFCQIHNIQANVPVENIIALLETVAEVKEKGLN